MGDVAKMSIQNEDLLYKLFGVNAELLIDHSWGWECATIESIRNYKPDKKSIGSGQVLHCPYNYEKTKLVVKEMAELLSLDLVEKRLVTSQLVLTVGYDIDNLTNPEISRLYHGEITVDHYGRNIPKHAHGTVNLNHKTSATTVIVEAVMKLYSEIVNHDLLVRRINLTANNVIDESDEKDEYEQINLFSNYEDINKKRKKEQEEREIQRAMLNIKSKYGKNAILKGMDLQADGTTIERNSLIGGHKA